MFTKQTANKEQVKLMIGLTGPSGSGKTFSALQLAYGITGDWSKIVVVDTENRSSLYYAGERTGLWEHIDFPPTVQGGYDPRNWVKMIDFVEQDPKTEVVILDSISHEWQGCLQLLEVYAKNAKGNTFTPWKIVTPFHDAFIDKMRHSRLHVIATMRTSTDYSMEKNQDGKTVPKKIGLKPTQREGVDYEFGVLFDIDISHYSSTSKDRTGLFAEEPPFLINPSTGEKLKAWALSGLVKEPVPVQAHVTTFDFSNDKHLIKLYDTLASQKIPQEYHQPIALELTGKEWNKENIEAAIEKTLVDDIIFPPSKL